MSDPSMAAIARAIVAHELEAARTPAELEAAMQTVFRRLYGQLVPVIGPVGFQAVTRRAMHLAEKARGGDLAIREFEWTEDALTLRGVAAAVEVGGADHARQSAAALLEHLLALLARLIGTSLTARVIQREWPEIVPDRLGEESEDP